MPTQLPDGFIPDGFVPDEPAQKPVKAQALPDGFVPDGFVPDAPIQAKTAPEGFVPDGFIPDKPAAEPESGILKDDELAQISSKTGVPIQRLKELAPYYGARSESDDSLSAKAKRVAGFADEAVLFGAGKGAYKKLGTSPQEEAALDQIQKLAEQRKSGWETAGELGAGLLVPGLGTAKALKGAGMATKLGIHALEGAAIGGISGAAKSEQGETWSGAAKGAALGGVLGAAIPVALKAGGELKGFIGKLAKSNPVAMERAEDDIIRKMETEAPRIESEKATLNDAINTGTIPQSPEGIEAVQNFLGHIKSNSLVEDIAKLSSVDPESAIGSLKQVQQQMGPEWVNREIANWQLGKVADTVLEEKLAQVVPRDTTIARRAGRFLLDGRSQARRIDRLTGVTSLEPLLDEASRNLNKMKVQMQTLLTQAIPVMKNLKAAGADQLTAADLRLAEEKGIDALPEALRAPMAAYQEFMTKGENSVLKQLQEQGIPIQEIKDSKAQVYIPRLTVDAPEAVSRVMDRARAVGINPKGEITKGYLAKISETPEGKELIDGAGWLSGRTINSENDLSLALKEILSPSSVTANLKKKIRSVQTRAEEGVPDYLRETDLAKLTGKYLHDTVEGATMQPIVQQLTAQGRLAAKAKDWDSANYIENLTRDLNGQREGTVASYSRKKAQELVLNAKEAAKQYTAQGDTKKAAVAEWLSRSPDMMNSLQRNIYPNFLGANPRAAMNNLTQAFFMTTPEIGGAYGGIKVLKAATKTLGELGGLLGKGQLKQEMEKSGQLGIQAHQESFDALKNGLAESGLTKDALNKATQVSMYLFEASEAINRRIVSNVASDIAHDLVKPGSKGLAEAGKLLSNLGPAYKTRVAQAVKNGNQAEVQHLLENYLTGKTMFNYNKLNMSEYGRTMGPFFSVFSKWPSSIAGDMVNTMGEKGMAQGAFDNAKRYLAPILALNALETMTGFDKEDPRNKALFGSQGLSSAAPGRAVTSITKGDIFTPPGLDIARKAATGIATADPYAMWSAGNDALAAYMPGGFLLRLLGNEYPKIIKGEESKGTFLGKAFSPEVDQFFKDGRADIHDILGK